MHHLLRDLDEWETLYLAGRLHKPVNVLREEAKVHLAGQESLKNAVKVALLQLPATFTDQELYLKISGMSYRGDNY